MAGIGRCRLTDAGLLRTRFPASHNRDLHDKSAQLNDAEPSQSTKLVENVHPSAEHSDLSRHRMLSVPIASR